MTIDSISAFREVNPKLPTVAVLATGGTIAGAGSLGKATNYRPGQLDVNALVDMAEGAHDIAYVRAVQICNVNSDDITADHWLALARTINEMATDPVIDGFVITHGTDTLDETAYFLNLVVKTEKPVVLTGAMRPATATSPDGPMNLLQSIALAGSPQARGRGVMVVFSDGIFGGRDVRKISTFQTDAFSASDFGCMGYMIDGVPHFYNASSKAHTIATEFNANDIDVPAPLVEQEIDNQMSQFDQQLRAQGMDLGTYMKYMGKEPAEFRDDIREEATKKVKTQMIVSAVADQEGFEATPEEISEELEKMAQQYGMEKEKLMEMIGPQNLSMIGGDLKVRKAVDFMYDNAVKK